MNDIISLYIAFYCRIQFDGGRFPQNGKKLRMMFVLAPFLNTYFDTQIKNY